MILNYHVGKKFQVSFNSSGTENFTFLDIESKYRQSYFEALDLIIKGGLIGKATKFIEAWKKIYD